MIDDVTALTAALADLPSQSDADLSALVARAQQLVAEATDAMRAIRAEQESRGGG